MRHDARQLAIKLYKNMKYGEGLYTDHLDDTAHVLLRFGFCSDDLGAAAWLHDSIEHQLLTMEQINYKFGPIVSQLVWCVTDGNVGNRETRKACSYRKMRVSPKSIVLKLADRIANVESCILTENRKLLKMYQEEQEEFENQLKEISETRLSSQGCSPMWAHLRNTLI